MVGVGIAGRSPDREGLSGGTFNAAATAVRSRLFLPGHRRFILWGAADGIRRLRIARVMVMIFRQLFDSVSSTYTYLIASRRGGEALVIDPVLEKVDRYIQLVDELDLRLVKAVDTHLHADHITGLGALRDRTHCVTVMGERSKVDV